MAEPANDVKRVEPVKEPAAPHAQKEERSEQPTTWANERATAVLQKPQGPPPPDMPELSPAMIMRLQRTSGNAAVEALLSARRRPAVQRCPDHSCGGNCSHVAEAATREEEKAPAIQRFSLTDVVPMGVGLMERFKGSGEKKDKVAPGESPAEEPVEGGPAKDSAESPANESDELAATAPEQGAAKEPKAGAAKDTEAGAPAGGASTSSPGAAPPPGFASVLSSFLGGGASPEKGAQPVDGEKTAKPQEVAEPAIVTLAPPAPDQSLGGAALPEAPPSPAAPGVPEQPALPSSAVPGPAHAPASGAAKPGGNGSPVHLLQSLASVPASMLGHALGRTSEAANLAHAGEVAAMVGSFPRIMQPTGLPAILERKPAPPTELPVAQVPEAKTPTPTLPSTARDGDSLEVGEKPKVQLTGEADPALSTSYHAETDQAVTSKTAEADTAAGADFGEKNTYPTIHPELLHPAIQPAAPAGVPHPAIPVPAPVPDAARAEFDQQASPWLKEQVGEQLAQRQEHEATYAKTTREIKEAGQREIAEETTKARTDQQQMRDQTQASVAAERSQWREENRQVTETYKQQAGSKRQELDREISGKVQTADREAGDKLTAAQNKAEQERKAAEAKAAQTKKDAESKPESWWDKAKGAVSSAFDAIKGAVSGIFDEMRKIVKGIIEVAKQAAHAVIDAARTVVVGLIRTFGTVLKGLATVALLAFPTLAAKMRARIDALVNAATDGVNKIADDLKKRADAVLDKIGHGIDTALRILQTGFTMILSGLEKLATLPFEAIGALARFIEMIKPWESLLEGGKKLEEAATSVIAQIQAALGDMIAQVPVKVDEAVNFAIDNVGGPIKKHLAGIWRHLKKGLGYLKDNWWAEIKKTAWNLVWPWPAVWKDLKQIWTEIKAAKQLVGNFEISQAINHGLKIVQTLNGIGGNLYGWFFIGSVLVGTIIGAFFGGVGAVPGAMAGLAVAVEVGEGLLASLIATETAVIAKGIWDLAFGSGKKEDNEDAYERIAGSGLTLGITGAMMVLGEIAADIAKSVFDAVVDLLRGEPPAVEVPTETVKGEPSTGEAGEAEATGAPADERIAAERPTADGEHEIKVTEEGRCLVCSTCEEIGIKYKQEIEANPDLGEELKQANAIGDADAKAEAASKVEAKLKEARQQAWDAEPADVKPARMGEMRTAAQDAIERVNELLKEHDTALKESGQYGEVKGELDWLEKEMERAESGAQGIGEDPELSDAAREEFDDVRAKAERLESKIEDATRPAEEPEVPAGPAEGDVPRPGLKHPANQLPTEGAHPYEAPALKGDPEFVRGPQGGYVDAEGNTWEWAKDQHGGPHWDVQHPNGTHTNVFPDGTIVGPDNF